MPQIETKIHPIGGFNSDDEDRVFPNTDYRYGLNGRSGSSDQRNVGGTESIRGNKLMEPALGIGERKIGTAQDFKNNAIIRFIYNPLQKVTADSFSVNQVSPLQMSIVNPDVPIPVGTVLSITQGSEAFLAAVTAQVLTIYTLNLLLGTPSLNPVTDISIPNYHHIRRYNVSTNVEEKLINPALMGFVLGFSLSSKIYNPRVIEAGFAQFLVWTDANKRPRCMNIDKMKEGGVYYNIAADAKYIDLKKTPPIKPATITYVNSGSLTGNLKNKFFQFRYRYQFSDFSYSELSPISKLSLSPNNVIYDAIGVTFNSGHHTVIKVEICYREGNGVSATGNVNPEWYVFNVFDKSVAGITDNTNYTINFLNQLSQIVKAVSRIDSDTIVYSVPDRADHQELVDTNQIILVGCEEGEDNVTMDCSTTQELYGANISWEIEQTSATVQTVHLEAITQRPLLGETLVIQFSDKRVIYYNIDAAALLNWPVGIYNMIKPDIEPSTGVTLSCAGIGSPIVFTWPSNITLRLLMLGSTFKNNKSIVPLLMLQTDHFYGDAIALANPNAQYLGFIEDHINFAEGSVNTEDVTFDDGGSHTVLATKYTSGINGFNIFQFIIQGSMQFTLSSPLRFTIKPQLYVNNNLVKEFPADDTGGPVSSYIYSQSVNTYFPLNEGDTAFFMFKIESLGGSTTFKCIGNNLVRASLGVMSDTYDPPDNSFYPINTAILGFKKGVKTSISVIYFKDNMSQGGANKAADVYFKTLNEDDNQSVVVIDNSTDGYLQRLRLQINNLAPSWATQYAIALKNNTNFGQGLITDVILGSVITLKIDTLGGYSPSIGDRIRAVGVYDKDLNFDRAPFLKTAYIIGVGTDGSVTLSNDDSGFHKGLIIEISRETNSILYFENGQFFDIVNGFHHGNIQNQTGSQPAISYIDGDTWFRVRENGTNQYIVESQQIVDGGDDLWNQGRPQIITPDQRKQYYPQMFRWSNQLFKNTQVNGLSVFDSGNVNQKLDASMGGVSGIRQRGNELKVFQWKNRTSILLGRRELTNADGSANVVATDTLLGSFNPDTDGMGTKHPGSIVRLGSHFYFFDSIRGMYCRDASNGGFAISEYKAVKYWRDKSDEVNANPNIEVVSGVDEKFKDIYVTMRDPIAKTQETIYFNEKQNRWKYLVDLTDSAGEIIDGYSWIGQSFFTSLHGNLWFQNKLETAGGYLKLFGHDKELIIEAPFATEDDLVKVIETHSIHSNKSPLLCEFTIPANDMIPNGMFSELKQGNYYYKEGVFYCEMKNDANTFGIPSTIEAKRYAIVNGRPLRGHVVNVRMKWKTNDIVVLYSSMVGMSISNKS